jgi:hypothetical protein
VAVVAGLALALSALVAGCGSDDDKGSSSDDPAAALFKGKTIRFLVTSSAGGNTDLFGRFVAKEIAAKIPGHPRIAVTNVGGLGGIGEAYEAPGDDLVIGVTSRSSAIYGSTGDPAAVHDPAKIQIIGGIAGDPRAWTAFGDLVDAYPSIADASGGDTEFRFAATVGTTADVESDVFLYSWLCENLSLNCKYVNVAEDSSSDTNLMVQRGEVNLQGGTVITFMRDYIDDLQDGKAKVMFQYATPENAIPLPDGLEAPELRDELPADLQADYDKILPIISSGNLGNMLWAGPETSPEVVAALSDAFAEVVSDDDTVAELNSIMAGGDSPYDYAVTPLTGDDAVDAYEESRSTFEDNRDYLEGLREEYLTSWQ